MTSAVSPGLLERLAGFVSGRMGLYFPKERLADLERALISASGEFGFRDPNACVEMLTSKPLTSRQVETLASYLTVGETYFFRESKSFRSIEEHVLPELVHKNRRQRRLRIWSAGCATGEEPYSIAILLDKTVHDLKSWNITILATDINTRFLEKASRGIYGEWSFRDTPAWVREGYFRKTRAGRFEILPKIREMVTFTYHNLAEDTYPSLMNNTNAMDLILCRNVLMYFKGDIEAKVARNLHRCLVDGGWLLVSPCEISPVLFPRFSAVKLSGATFYRKQESARETPKQAVFSPPEVTAEEASGSCLDTGRIEIIAAMHEPAIPETPVPVDVLKAEAAIAHAAKQADSFAEALSLCEEGSYGAAAEKILALSGLGENARAMALLAKVYANEGRLAEALEWGEKAVTIDKLNPDCYYLRATILEEQGKVEEALESLKKALYLDQDYVLAHFALGSLTRVLGRTAESERYFRNAVRLLERQGKEEVVASSEGITAGRLIEIIHSAYLRKEEDERTAVT